MDENNVALSQDAIDALLDSGQSPEDEGNATGVAAPAEPGPGAEDASAEAPVAGLAGAASQPSVPDLSLPARAPVTVNAPPPPGVTPPPGVVHAQQPATSGPVDEERAAAIAEEVAGAAVSTLHDGLSTLSGRVKALEAALKKIEALEKEVAHLKAQKAQGEALTVEVARPLAERVVKLEKAAKHSPVFNIYEKFTCASCESHGAAQVRTRCGVCGKEGWFGRSKAA